MKTIWRLDLLLGAVYVHVMWVAICPQRTIVNQVSLLNIRISKHLVYFYQVLSTC